MDQYNEFDSLHWFQSVLARYKAEKASIHCVIFSLWPEYFNNNGEAFRLVVKLLYMQTRIKLLIVFEQTGKPTIGYATCHEKNQAECGS